MENQNLKYKNTFSLMKKICKEIKRIPREIIIHKEVEKDSPVLMISFYWENENSFLKREKKNKLVEILNREFPKNQFNSLGKSAGHTFFFLEKIYF